MKIKAIERRKMFVSNSEYKNIYKAMNNPRTYFCKINGNDYYLAEANMISSNLYEVVFVSQNKIEIDMEVIENE
jgi:hypothetical protein